MIIYYFLPFFSIHAFSGDGMITLEKHLDNSNECNQTLLNTRLLQILQKRTFRIETDTVKISAHQRIMREKVIDIQQSMNQLERTMNIQFVSLILVISAIYAVSLRIFRQGVRYHLPDRRNMVTSSRRRLNF